MIRISIVALVVALSASLAGVASGAPPGASFQGSWEAIDVDDSNLDMNISKKLKVTVRDDFTTVCGGTRSVAKGTGTATGPASFDVTLTVRCLGGGVFDDGSRTRDFDFTFTYDAGTDAVTGFSAVGPWTRR